MCCVDFLVKYLLFIVNLAFSLLGLAIIGLGIASLIYLQDLNDILPINVIPISMIVLGVVVFFIAFLACCGAIRGSQCMLLTYAITVGVLAGLKIWLTVVVFNGLSDIQTTVDGWIISAFDNNNGTTQNAFNVLELSFRCCGTTGADSYGPQPLPPTCCGYDLTTETVSIAQCTPADAFAGCATTVADWFETFGSAVGGVLIVVIIVEIVAILFALNTCNAVKTKWRSNY